MKRHVHLIAFLCVLAVLSLFQIALDCIFDGGAGGDSSRKDITAASDGADYCIFIDIEGKTLYLLENGKCIRGYPIASGMSGLPSPLGCWEIVEKGDWGEGFGGRWMGLNVPWGTYGIHGTLFDESIGTAASHGCIRMYSEDVKELYGMVDVGTTVVITNGSFGPFGRGFDEINPGDRGADVMEIQKRLKQLGFYTGALDGIYDEGMKKAVHGFQRANKLEAKNTITLDDWHAMGFSLFD